MKVQINKGTHYGRRPDGFTERWVISPARPSEADDGFASYSLEIQVNGIVGEQIDRIAYKSGERFEFLPDDEWQARVEDWMEHEGVTADEAGERLVNQNVWSYGQAGSLGFRTDFFQDMEEAWHAIGHFVHFAITN